MGVNKRAVNERQKRERRESILRGTLQLFCEREACCISTAEIAEKAGLGKGTLFLYFETKEEIFRELTLRETGKFLSVLEEQLVVFTSKNNLPGIKDFLGILKESVSWKLLRLLCFLLSSPERNSESALDFCKRVGLFFHRSGEILEKFLTFIPAGKGPPTIFRIFTVLLGVHATAGPSCSPLFSSMGERRDSEFHIGFWELFEELITPVLLYTP